MRVKTLSSIIYDGKTFGIGEEVEISDIYINDLLKRKLIEKIDNNTNEEEEVNENVDLTNKDNKNVENLEDLTMKELKEMAEGLSIEVPNKITKEHLINLILEFRNNNTNEEENVNENVDQTNKDDENVENLGSE